MMTESAHTKTQRVFGRRKGRPLRTRKSQLMRDLLPQLRIDLSRDRDFNPAKLFPFVPDALWLEIGFGGGEHLAARAALHPQTGFIGCEPFVNGVASLLEHVEREGLDNVRVFPDDARMLLDALPHGVLSRVDVLFADPWPKARHAERRFIGPENLIRLARVVRPGGELRMATDDENLKEWMKACLGQQSDFIEVATALQPPADWISTRYEQKAIKAGRVPLYFSYRRK